MFQPVDKKRCCSRPPKKKRLGAKERNRIVGLLRALGDPTRLEIFRLIAGSAVPICVCDIVERFHVGQPTVSHHLKVLRSAGLVCVTREGVWSHYCADAAGLDRAREILTHLVPAGDSVGACDCSEK